jgi:hypothetical protein
MNLNLIKISNILLAHAENINAFLNLGIENSYKHIRINTQ